MSCPLSFGDPYGALNETGYHCFGGKDPTPLALLRFKINKTSDRLAGGHRPQHPFEIAQAGALAKSLDTGKWCPSIELDPG
jgi:hypothetical protein